MADYELLQYEFQETLAFLMAQRESALESCVMRGSVHSKANRVSTVGSIDMVEKTSQHSQTPNTAVPLAARWTVQSFYEAAHWVDRYDDLRSIIANIESAYLRRFVQAANRRKDATVLGALGGTAHTGTLTPTADAALPSAQKVAVNDHTFDRDGGTGDVGLTVYKVHNALEIIESAMGSRDGLEIYGAMPAKQKHALMTEIQVSNSQYNSAKPLTTGELNDFFGINWRTYEDSLIETDGNSDELVYIWVKDAMKLDYTQELFTRITEDHTHSYDSQVYASLGLGAVRIDDEGVVEIACDPTPTL